MNGAYYFLDGKLLHVDNSRFVDHEQGMFDDESLESILAVFLDYFRSTFYRTWKALRES